MSWDEREYDRLFRERYGDIVRFSHGFTGSRMAAEDLAQDAFVRLWNRGPKKRPDADRWLFRVVRNAALDWIKMEARRIRRESEATAMEQDAALFPEEELRQVRRLVESLSHRSREVLLLQVFSGLSVAEIGKIVGRSKNVVKQDLHRARERLRLAWQKEYGASR